MPAAKAGKKAASRRSGVTKQKNIYVISYAPIEGDIYMDECYKADDDDLNKVVAQFIKDNGSDAIAHVYKLTDMRKFSSEIKITEIK